MKKIFTKISLLTASLLFLGTYIQEVKKSELYYNNNNSLDPNKIILLSTDASLGNELLLYSQWQSSKLIQIITKTEKENFSKEFAKIFPKNIFIQEIVFGYVSSNIVAIAETLRYKFKDTMSLRNFWQSLAFAKSMEKILKTNYPEVLVNVKGWKEDTIKTEFDDPAAENRYLFKINLSLINGTNQIYITLKQSRAVIESTTINFPAEYKAVADRELRFHNSEVENNCTACHDGLPASSGGEEFTADCKTCHKSFTLNAKVHSPVEMNECMSCHSWSKESKAVVVEKAVPEVCADCHSEITSGAENDCQHAVLNDCLTCHTPHSSNYKRLLKDEVYNICKDCHDGYLNNHPVSNHPVRFRKLSEDNNELISCVSCHNPHSSKSKALIKVSGGRLAVCVSCHNR